MKYRLLDILACPYDKTFPLKLIVFKEKRYEHRQFKGTKPVCELYCGLKGKKIEELKPEELNCEDCLKREIVEGILICPKCNRWFPIKDEIPILLPDEFRKKSEDLEFLRKYSDKIPKEILEKGKPVNLSEG